MKKIKILLIEDEVMVRQGFRALLEREPFTRKVLEAGSGAEALTILFSEPDIEVVLLDIRLKDIHGTELARKIREHHPDIRIIAVTGLDGSELILNLLTTGIHGFVQKMNGFEEIQKAIRTVMDDGQYFPERVVEVIKQNADQWEGPPPVTLSEQELSLLRAIVSGSTAKEMADKLNLAMRTVETYRVRLMKKTNTLNTAGLIAYGFRNGIIQ
ncbi:MAG: response regulator transcription factor [Cyclobacteriaceae bacterium]|nr:response regulator transcription factor [Cyclobacteriaceae bacterium]